ncbi:MAG TPA: homoserine kinase [Alphaproteobacteria bacterium]|nr:homoserine kinase [Alphaproteobacteria bacterium]
MAVYTDVGDDELEAFLSDYDVGTLVAFKGIAEGVENSNFLVETDRALYILTLYERRVKVDDLPFFLGLMDHLAAKGIACPVPVKARDGKALRSLAGRPATLVTFLKGVWPRRIAPLHCQLLGGAMASFHLAGRDYKMTRANALDLSGWCGLFQQIDGRADEVAPDLAAEIARDLSDITAKWPKGLPAGIVHADLFPDNVFFLGEHLSGIIDFYFACEDYLAYDLAIALNAWCFEPDSSFNITKARGLLNAYAKVRPLEPTELAALPLLARGAAMRFLLTRLYDWLNRPEGALVKPKDPREYLKKLRFHRQVKSPEAYGLD